MLLKLLLHNIIIFIASLSFYNTNSCTHEEVLLDSALVGSWSYITQPILDDKVLVFSNNGKWQKTDLNDEQLLSSGAWKIEMNDDGTEILDLGEYSKWIYRITSNCLVLHLLRYGPNMDEVYEDFISPLESSVQTYILQDRPCTFEYLNEKESLLVGNWKTGREECDTELFGESSFLYLLNDRTAFLTTNAFHPYTFDDCNKNSYRMAGMWREVSSNEIIIYDASVDGSYVLIEYAKIEDNELMLHLPCCDTDFIVHR